MLPATDNRLFSQQLDLPLGIGEPTPVWRPIHYLGSKLRHIGAIRKIISEIDPNLGTACDLFAGSGTVSLGLSNDRSVVAADVQEYSRVLCSAILQPALLDGATASGLFKEIDRFGREFQRRLEPILDFEEKAIEKAGLTPTLLCDLVERGSLLSTDESGDALSIVLKETRARLAQDPRALMATRYFGGIYFSYSQTLFIDSALCGIAKLPPEVRDTCTAALLSTASAIVNTVGKQFAQPIRPRRSDGTIKEHLVRQMSRDRRLDGRKTFEGWLSRYRGLRRGGTHRIMRGDYREILPQLGGVSVIYADPPYTRDHYSRFYHVLETLCLRDDPAVSTTSLTGQGETSRGLYRVDRHQSPFCIKSQATEAFAELFKGSRKLGVPLLVSYSPFLKDGHPRLMTVEGVTKIAREYYRRVRVVAASPIPHSKLNKAELHLEAGSNAEILIICEI